MNRIPVIDMTATGINITRMRINAGLTVKDLQDVFLQVAEGDSIADSR